MAALEAEAQAEQAEGEGKENSGEPVDQSQRNFTDPESRTMPAAAAGTCSRRTTARRWRTLSIR